MNSKIIDAADTIGLIVTVLIFAGLLISQARAEIEQNSQPEPLKVIRLEESVTSIEDVPEAFTEEDIPEEWKEIKPFKPYDCIPLDEWEQEYLFSCCKEYNVPVTYALAIIESETHFNWDAVGSCGEIGIFQVHPINWEWATEKNQDPHTHAGNICTGVEILSNNIKEFGEMDKATMGFKCGTARAHELINEGVKLSICDTVSGYAEKWEELLNGT